MYYKNINYVPFFQYWLLIVIIMMSILLMRQYYNSICNFVILYINNITYSNPRGISTATCICRTIHWKAMSNWHSTCPNAMCSPCILFLDRKLEPIRDYPGTPVNRVGHTLMWMIEHTKWLVCLNVLKYES